MSEIEVFTVEAKKLRLVIGGNKYEGRFPYHGERRKYLEAVQKMMDEKREKEVMPLVEELFAKLGFPQEAIDELDVDNFKGFLEIVLKGGKKN